MMKKNKLRVVTWVVLLLSISCRQVQSPSPLNFRGYEGNPILTPGEPGSWDELMLLGPQVYWHDSLFYLFYTASNINNKVAVGLATSKDGFHFKKHEGNPILSPDGIGYDANLVADCILQHHDGLWILFFGAGELIRYGPGQSIGRATAESITGPWTRDEKPILTVGSRAEWDEGFIFPSSIVELSDGSYRLYYSGGGDFQGEPVFYTGMASSKDGVIWKKYNNPETNQHPFAESDPVLIPGNENEFDSHGSWCAFVYKKAEGYTMYYSGSSFIRGVNKCSVGYATSLDGINWEKFPDNPLYSIGDDPFLASIRERKIIEGSWLVFLDTVCFMYYDYGVIVGKIGMATALLK